MSFSCNKTTLVLVHGVLTAAVLKQSTASRILVLTNTGLDIYANNFNNDPKFINISRVVKVLTGANLAREALKHKQVKRSFVSAITSALLDVIK
jgi:hypothetical protein